MGITLLLDKEGIQRLRALIVKDLDNFEGNLARDSSRLKFVYTMKDETIEHIFTHNELLCYVNNSQEDDLIEWRFNVITAQEGLLPRTHPNYNGSSYNLTI